MTLERQMEKIVSLWADQSVPVAKLWQDGEVTAYLAQNPEARDVAKTICDEALQSFTGCEVFPRITIDPDTGSKNLTLNVSHTMDDARAKSDDFYQRLPDGVNDGGPITVCIFKKRG